MRTKPKIIVIVLILKETKGIIIDNDLKCRKYDDVREIAFFHPRNIAHVGPHLGLFDAKKCINALVFSLFEYSKALLIGLPLDN